MRDASIAVNAEAPPAAQTAGWKPAPAIVVDTSPAPRSARLAAGNAAGLFPLAMQD